MAVTLVSQVVKMEIRQMTPINFRSFTKYFFGNAVRVVQEDWVQLELSKQSKAINAIPGRICIMKTNIVSIIVSNQQVSEHYRGRTALCLGSWNTMKFNPPTNKPPPIIFPMVAGIRLRTINSPNVILYSEGMVPA